MEFGHCLIFYIIARSLFSADSHLVGFVETRQAQNVLYKQIDFSTCGPRTAGCGPLGFLFLHNDQHIEFECILTGMNFILFDTFKFVLWAPTRSGKLDGLRPGPASQF
jgi:hypothetical protein